YCGRHYKRIAHSRPSTHHLREHIVPRLFSQSNLAHHTATAHQRTHIFQQVALTIQDTNTGWSEHLVGAKAQEIDIEGPHIYRKVGNTLCCIEQNDGSGCMSEGDHLLSRIDGAQHVRHVCKGYKFGLLL